MRAGFGTLSTREAIGESRSNFPLLSLKKKAEESIKRRLSKDAGANSAKGDEGKPAVHLGKGRNSKEPQFRLRKVYAGQWERDQRSGVGTAFYANGDIYQGAWHADLRHGWGVCHYADGSVYEGEYQQQLRHGQGILRLGMFWLCFAPIPTYSPHNNNCYYQK
jgi:hypothetical protein